MNLLSSLQIETMSDDLGVPILGTHNVPSGYVKIAIENCHL